MKDYLKILLVIIVSLIAGSFIHKCQSPSGNIPGRGECMTDTLKVYDTILYYAPKPQSELAIGTHTYTLPKSYIISGGWRAENVTAKAAGTQDYSCAEVWSLDIKGEGTERGDSAIVELPIIQRHYADSTYEAWISGPIEPRLDSLRVFAPTTIITKREWKPPKRWHIGPTIGYGYTPQGFQPYIGVSITYSIISF